MGAPVNNRPKLGRDDVRDYACKLGDLASWMADQSMPLAYHHHMGSMIEDEEDVNWLMDGSPRAVHLHYDTWHLLFAGRCWKASPPSARPSALTMEDMPTEAVAMRQEEWYRASLGV